MNETEDTHPGESIPLTTTLLFNNAALVATLKNSAAFMHQ